MKPQIITNATTLDDLKQANGQAKWQLCRNFSFDGIVVGDRDFCNEKWANFTHIIHIWRTDYPQNSCQFRSNGVSLRLEYKDGEELTETTMQEIEVFIELFRKNTDPKQLLIHCAAGITRSPTIALLAASLLHRKHPSVFIGNILRELRSCRGLTPNICHKPLECICQFVEVRGIFS